MKVKMRAVRRCYVPSLQGEFNPGQTFDAESEREAQRLERRQTAERASATEHKGVEDPKPLDTSLTDGSENAPKEEPVPDEIETLRAKYTRLTGLSPDRRWKTDRLVSETNRYNRRDMRAREDK